MIQSIDVSVKRPVILQATDIVFSQKPYWCNATRFPLKMSILHPRSHFSYDEKTAPMPCIIWITGGGWTEVDHNVWMPELVYYAQRGYVVASVSYSLPATWFFPEMLIDIKQAIRYIRAHAEEWNIDSNRIAVMGESAGGHLAALTAVTGKIKDFDRGEYLQYSSEVQAAVTFYCAVDMINFEGRDDLNSYEKTPQNLLRANLEPQSIAAGVPSIREAQYKGVEMDPRSYIDSNTPPFMLLHGTEDTLVPIYHSELLYSALKNAGVKAEFLKINGVDHAASAFVQEEVKSRVVEFLNDTLK